MASQAGGPSDSLSALRTSKLSTVVLDNHSSSGISSNIRLHPLPILNISEHLVRTRLQSEDAQLTVYGVLLGTQQGRDIDIQNSFEIRLDAASSTSLAPIINHAFLRSRQAQYKQVFPTLDLLGWYTVGEVPTPQDLEVHKQLLAYNETPLLVQLHQTVASFENAEANGELPIRVYESVVELVQGETTNFFVPAGYKIETGEAERIAVDYASKAGAESGGDHDSMLAGMQAQHSAITKLNDRIRQVLTYLEAVKDGQAGWDHQALRQIQTVVANLPQTVLPELQEELLREHNDVLLTNYLSVLTESLHTMNELSDKFEVVQAAGKEDGVNAGILGTSKSGAQGRRGGPVLRSVYG
ncbi:uncharacterized protein UMAG_11451 [Mycosarcoma maydis]|uniref:COP9 signalosome complex subunit 6 n=1 Tax=Mycosarcoma maydis TaxID=5270 RepID=A0A0D1CGZ2_MYCMD|nr:uncharacterized protein UMAG_11451 [Ustilago maydis 521]KIS72227.1 hypothetical protein UMAG_11451 [Ustilago maydis 521]|eukprot:XP_011386777.1 hypothetical protein UMAG_11451 [Ustilago maydis 521]